MGWRRNENEVVLTDGVVEFGTEKAILIDSPWTAEPCWLPRSQIVAQYQIGIGVWEFIITEWIAGKNGII